MNKSLAIVAIASAVANLIFAFGFIQTYNANKERIAKEQVTMVCFDANGLVTYDWDQTKECRSARIRFN